MGLVPIYPAFLPASGNDDQSLPWGRRISSFTERVGDCTQHRTNSCRSLPERPSSPALWQFRGNESHPVTNFIVTVQIRRVRRRLILAAVVAFMSSLILVFRLAVWLLLIFLKVRW